MTYSRKYLRNFKIENGTASIEQHNVTQELCNKLYGNQELSLAEEQYTCTALGSLRSDDPDFRIKLSEIEGCKNFWFRDRYLMYYSNLNGDGKVFDYYGEITGVQKQEDIKFLEDSYQNWLQVINSKSHPDKLTEYISTETKHQIKNIIKHCNSFSIGHFRQEYLKKSIVLHGRYIYYLVKEFYQELGANEENITLFNNKIVIESYCYVHILFRHFASIIKEHQTDKTYHFDEHIPFDSIPDFLKIILIKFRDNLFADDFNTNFINFIFYNKTYSIWFRKISVTRPGNIIETYLRLQTFYPISKASELEKISNFKKVKIDSVLTFLISNK